MAYRSLLVQLGADAACPERVKVAIALARDQGAHLVGLAATGRLDLPVAVDAATMSAGLIEAAWSAMRTQAALAAQSFTDACTNARLRSVEAVVVEEDAAAALVRHAHCSDLVLLGQVDRDAPGHRMASEVLETVLMGCARPVLVVPYAGRQAAVSQRPMVAWDDSREAARAVADALPLLRRAECVQVLAWREGPDEDTVPLAARLQALQQWLAWHGVRAETAVEVTTIDIADAMLSRAADLDADLLVMGAYGHRRLAERLLGGATRGLLQSMTLPVLMSH
jgi:nucleotide-binding universal stress UspA family protein